MTRFLLHACFAALLACAALLSDARGAAAADTFSMGSTTETIPAGTHVKFHLNETISSNQSKTGQPFDFVLLEPVTVDGREILPAGTTGSGTVYLAGKAGSGGHEGDLTLRLDAMHTPDGRVVTFADERFEINGKNEKTVSRVLGFVPYVGIFARLIRGSDVSVDQSKIVETTLKHPATITIAPAPVPSASAAAASKP
jgi:hypothetical protein